MTTYSLCKARYADPASWRYGTVDAVIFDAMTESSFLYSVVYSNRKLLEVHMFPCVPQAEAPDWIPTSFEALQEMFKEKTAHPTEAMETVCAERLSVPEVMAAIKEDLTGTPSETQRVVIDSVKECFMMADGPGRRRP